LKIFSQKDEAKFVIKIKYQLAMRAMIFAELQLNFLKIFSQKDEAKFVIQNIVR
jgi:hypothetical protein